MNETFYPKEHKTGLDELIDVSREYGNDPAYVLGGGGNTSWKSHRVLYVKASGSAMATLSHDSLVAMKLPALDRIWTAAYPSDTDTREAMVLADLIEARVPGQGERRPSVETLLHALFPFHFVVHTHPAKFNGLSCARRGHEYAEELFGDDMLWIPCIEPGYVLAKEVKDRIDERLAKGLTFPKLLFLQNHGIFVAANSVAEIRGLYKAVMTGIDKHIERRPSRDIRRLDPSEYPWLSELLPGLTIRSIVTEDILRYAADAASFTAVRLAPTPDHIVYYGYRPVYVTDHRDLKLHIEAFKRDDGGRYPRIIVVKDLGAFACAEQDRSAELAEQLFLDAIHIAVYGENFGGIAFMPDHLIQFIRSWEVEKYRAAVTK